MPTTTSIHQLNDLDESVKAELLELTASWYEPPAGTKRWKFTLYGARSLLLKPSGRRNHVYVALARDNAGALIGWTVVALRHGEHAIVNAYVGELHRGRGVSGTMIEAVKAHAGGPVVFHSYGPASDAVAAQHGLVLKERGQRGGRKRRRR